MKKAIINILFCLIVIGLGIIIYNYVLEKTGERYSVSGIISATENSGEESSDSGNSGTNGFDTSGSGAGSSDAIGSGNSTSGTVSGNVSTYSIPAAGSSELAPVTLFVGINPDSAAITDISLEILRCGSHSSLTYISIPSDSRFTMSEELYQKLSALLPQMPQIATLSETFHYFGIKELPKAEDFGSHFENRSDIQSEINYGSHSEISSDIQSGINPDIHSEINAAMTALTSMLSELAGTKISSYVLVTSDTFETLFTPVTNSAGNSNAAGNSSSENKSNAAGNSIFETNTSSLVSESGRHLEMFRAIWSEAFTSTNLDERLVYLDTFDALQDKDITLLTAEGERTNYSFTIDKNSLTLRVYNAMNK